jgi:hypothetical protein
MKALMLQKTFVVQCLFLIPLFLHGIENRVQLYYDGTNTCVYLYGQPQSRDSFCEKLERIGKISSAVRFSVQVCPDVPFKDVVSCVSLMQNAGVTNLVIDMRKWGEAPVPSQVRLGLLLLRKYKIVYQGSTLNAVPEDE